MVLICRAESLCCQKKSAEAKSFAKKVWEILDKMETTSPPMVAVGFTQIAKVYKKVGELETALSLLKRVLPILEKLPAQFSSHPCLNNIFYKIGELLQRRCKAEEAIPYLEKGIQTMKTNVGSKHYDVGYAYWFLGSAYFDANQPELSVLLLGRAKDIMDETLGPHHVNSINVRKDMCRSYAAMGRYALAINLLEETIECLKAVGPHGQYELVQAARLMAELKESMSGIIPDTNKKMSKLLKASKKKETSSDISDSLKGLKIQK